MERAAIAAGSAIPENVWIGRASSSAFQGHLPARLRFRAGFFRDGLTAAGRLLKLNEMVDLARDDLARDDLARDALARDDLANARLDDVYQALASPTRRRIVSLLARQPLNIAKLAPAFDMSLTAVSKHVKLLERAGIVSTTMKGRAHVCRLEPEALHEAHAWLEAYQGFWTQRLDAFEKVLLDDEKNEGGGAR